MRWSRPRQQALIRFARSVVSRRLSPALGHMQCKQAVIVFVQHRFQMQYVVDTEHPFASRLSLNFLTQ